MKNALGKQIIVRFDGATVKGKLLSDLKDRIVVGGNDPEMPNMTIIKSKISAWSVADGEPSIPIYVFACANPAIQCKGIRCTKTALEPTREDYDFMDECPAREGTCSHGCFGEILSVPNKMLIEALGDVMLGDFPEKPIVSPLREGKTKLGENPKPTKPKPNIKPPRQTKRKKA